MAAKTGGSTLAHAGLVALLGTGIVVAEEAAAKTAAEDGVTSRRLGDGNRDRSAEGIRRKQAGQKARQEAKKNSDEEEDRPDA